MENYTGEENNTYDIAFWESMRILPSACETAKIAEEYVKSVCVGLYKQKGGEYAAPDFFDKNFQIIVEDSPQIQASLMYKEYSKDGRNILRVSKGLINSLQNEAQLAFVLAHELGHYEIYETRNDDKNGINVSGHEHEVQADYIGFQSVLQAGYNPDEAVSFFKIIQENPTVTEAFERANDEHGSTETRIANIKDYKSTAEVRGVKFSEYTGEESFRSFQEKFNEAAKHDHYISYLEERIRQEYNVASGNELPLDKRWEFVDKIITQEPEVLSTVQRQAEFARIFSQNITSLSKEEALKADSILQKVYTYENGITGKEKFTSDCMEKLPEKDENGDYYITPYGSFAHRIEYMKEVVSGKEEVLNELKEITGAHNVANRVCGAKDMHFDYPEFSIKALKVGDTVPWEKASSVVNASNKESVRSILGSLGVDYNYFEHKYGDSIGYPLGMENSVYINSKGVIISTDANKVTELRAESKEKVANLFIGERKRQMKLDFHDQLAIMAQNGKGDATYNQAKQTAAEIYKRSINAFTNLDNTQDFLLKDISVLRIRQSDSARPSARVFAEEAENNQLSVWQSANPKYAALFYPQYAEVVLETELENIRDVYHATRYPKVEKTLEFVNGLYNNLLDESSGMNAVSREVIQKTAPAVFKAYSDEIGDAAGKKSVEYFNRIITQTLMNDHVGAGGNLPYVEEFRQKHGIGDVRNTDDLIANLEKMKPDEKYSVYVGTMVGYSKLLYDYEVIRAINAGVEIDVSRTLNAFPNSASPDLADKITDYVIQKDLFAAKEGETAEQTYDRCKELYITMSAKDAFTQKENKQRQFETKLSDMMKLLPPERRIKEAYDLLSTHADYGKPSQNAGKGTILAQNIKELGGSILQYDGNKRIAEQIYADHIIQKYGPDDQSQSYRENMNTELGTMAADISSGSRKRICQQVAKGIMAQKELAFDIKDIHDMDITVNTVKGETVRGYNLIETYMRYQPEFARKTMDFLLSSGNNADCEKFSADLAHEYNRNRSNFPAAWKATLDKKLTDSHVTGFTASDLEKLPIPENSFVAVVSKMHEEYANAGFEERSLIMHRMLDYYGKNPDAEQSMQTQIAYVSDKVFGTQEKDKDLLKEVKIISGAVCHQEEQPSLLLGAVLAGREPGQADENMNVGDGLTMFCEKKGTAWVKLAQTLSYVDALPQEIRDSLGRLKDKANEPKQWEIYTDLEEAMPESELARIKKVQKFIGGGTFNKTILVDVENNQTGQAETKVVQVMHDRAKTKSEREFAKINNAIDELCQKDPKYEILKSVAERSSKNAKIEVDINKGADQYRNACENYGKIKSVELNGVAYVPKVASWERYGESKFSNYKIMEMAPGKSIDSAEFTSEQRRDMALAYTVIELTNLMGGKAWDIDRHSKQQNFNVTKDENGKTIVEIGIFDTGAQRAAPTNKEKELLGRFLVAVLKEQQKGNDSNLSEFMLSKIKKFEKAGKDVNYVSDVQRGLLAISDVMKYMNTPENPNGMAEGLKTSFGVLRKNNLIDETLYKTLIKQTVKTALTNPKFGKSVVETLSQSAESKDQISINLNKDRSKIDEQIKSSIHVDKPKHETEIIELGKTRIKPKPLTPEQQVEKTLSNMGIERKSYMMLTSSDSWLEMPYNQEGHSIKGYLNRQEEAAKNGVNMLMGMNNGYTAVYFAKENIYVVSPSCELGYAMQRNSECKNVGYGVMFSNGEKFKNSDIKNSEWENVVKYVKANEKGQQQNKETNNQSNSLSEVSQGDKVKKAFELSGRGGTNPVHAIAADEKAVILEQGVQNNNANAPQVKTEPQISSAEKVADMSEKEKGKFFHKLRMGINTILHKKAQDGLSVQPMSKTQTNIQQPNTAQMKISNDRGGGR